MPNITVKWDNLDAAFAEFEREVTDIVRGLIVFTWNTILSRTPQYFGGMAASWTFTYRANNIVDRSHMVPGRAWLMANYTREPWENPNPKLYKGHRDAVSIANGASAGRDTQFKLGKTVYFTNGVNDPFGGEYSSRIESTPGALLRQYNRPGRPVGRTIDMITARFGEDVTRHMAMRFKTLRIGDVSADS